MAHKKGFYEKYFKRPQDFLCAAAATVALSPVMGVTALLVRKKLGTPVLFTQDRPGLNGKVFKLYKFRSMTDERDEQGNLLPDDIRLTSFGKKLRATSLDELPELFNILKGDMAVVGPRPLLVQYLNRYNEHQARRHEVRPGFTGMAQVHGRNAISWEEKFDWDVKYVDHISFLGDWKIIFETIKTVLKHEGISAVGEATMGEFMGSTEMCQGRKKILILANNDSGLYRFRKELLESLIAAKYDVFCCTPKGSYVEAIQELGCTFLPCNVLQSHGTDPKKDLRLLQFYKKTIQSIQPDIVFTYTIKPNVYGGMACAWQQIPYVANITGLGTAVENGGALQLMTSLLYKYGLRKAQKVFFQNTANRDFMLKHGIVKKNYDVIPGSGVNLEQYSVAPYPNGETTDFFFVARVMKEKGIDQYLEAAKTIRARHPETCFHVCGYAYGSYMEVLKKYQENEIIQYHGLVRDMEHIYRMASCVVLPTYYPEGLNNVLLESAASGRPIIATDRPGCREIMDDGVNGFVVKQQDSADLIEKIEKFLSLRWEQRRDMGLAGRAKVEREFNRNIVVNKYLGEIQNSKN